MKVGVGAECYVGSAGGAGPRVLRAVLAHEPGGGRAAAAAVRLAQRGRADGGPAAALHAEQLMTKPRDWGAVAPERTVCFPLAARDRPVPDGQFQRAVQRGAVTANHEPRARAEHAAAHHAAAEVIGGDVGDGWLAALARAELS